MDRLMLQRIVDAIPDENLRKATHVVIVGTADWMPSEAELKSVVDRLEGENVLVVSHHAQPEAIRALMKEARL